MPRHVLLVEPDVDALGKLAEALRARGLSVAIASDLGSAVDRSHGHRPHLVFVAESLAASLEEEPFRGSVLASLSRVFLVHGGGRDDLSYDRADYDDIDRLVTRALEVKPASTPPESSSSELRGDVQQLSLPDLLQLLAMNRRTGVLSVSTNTGAGEVRLTDGEVLDAVYRRLEGEKAFYRLLSEREGAFVFAPGGPPAVPRVTKGTSALLMEAMRHKDEVARLRDELGVGSTAFVATERPLPDDAGREARDVFGALSAPRTVDELLDEVSETDLDVLEALRELVALGCVRSVERGGSLAQLAPPEHMPVLRALLARIGREGFGGPPRIVVASTPSRLLAFAHALSRIAGTQPPGDPPPIAPVPHVLGSVRLGEGVELVLVGLPLVEAFSPVWSLTLSGVSAVLRLDGGATATLDAICRALEVRLMPATELVEGFDETDADKVARAVRGLIEQAGVT